MLFQRNDFGGFACPFIYHFRVDLSIYDALMGQHSADSQNINAIGGKQRGKLWRIEWKVIRRVMPADLIHSFRG